MRNATRLVLLASALVWLTSAAGCVTKGKFEDAEAQRDRALSQRDDLTVQLGEVTAANTALRDELEATEMEVSSLRGTYDNLVMELQTEVEAGQVEVQQLLDGIRLNVSDELLFASGSARINEGGRKLLERVAAQIADEDAIISVEGHTDNVAISRSLKDRYPTNWELAAARACSVVRLLSENGVEPIRLRAVSRGPFVPIMSNDTREGRKKNRRTELILRPLPS
ncbi:MAG: OmpA family protein [Deltaproteobacteria bacterium]|nr:OmpA family protein [Deltaproteobacteria bacterium]MBW2385039.1 OmpA family protein [Deltaproteobacteria bacterium]MBW2694937.1 OmpA family protein [Deltaproteobacteria bacterium]